MKTRRERVFEDWLRRETMNLFKLRCHTVYKCGLLNAYIMMPPRKLVKGQEIGVRPTTEAPIWTDTVRALWWRTMQAWPGPHP